MSKKAKKLQKEKRLEKKRARRTANKARYAALRDSGQNSKSKRFVKNSKRMKRVKTIDHPLGSCGNIGCKRCDPNKIHSIAA